MRAVSHRETWSSSRNNALVRRNKRHDPPPPGSGLPDRDIEAGLPNGPFHQNHHVAGCEVRNLVPAGRVKTLCSRRAVSNYILSPLALGSPANPVKRRSPAGLEASGRLLVEKPSGVSAREPPTTRTPRVVHDVGAFDVAGAHPVLGQGGGESRSTSPGSGSVTTSAVPSGSPRRRRSPGAPRRWGSARGCAPFACRAPRRSRRPHPPTAPTPAWREAGRRDGRSRPSSAGLGHTLLHVVPGEHPPAMGGDAVAGRVRPGARRTGS